MTISLKADSSGTFGEVLVNGSPVLKVSNGLLELPDGKDFFNQGNIVGTVSQSGGIATGAVVERGSNANGEYVRFADGTQICWTSRVIGTTVANGVVNSTWTLPAAFSLVPTSNLSLLTSVPNNYMPSVGTPTTTTIVHHAYAAIAGTSIIGYAIAIGRWF